MDLFLFDKRIVRKNIEKGNISQEEYRAYLDGLEDMADKCEQVEEKLYPDETAEAESEEGNEGDATPEN